MNRRPEIRRQTSANLDSPQPRLLQSTVTQGFPGSYSQANHSTKNQHRRRMAHSHRRIGTGTGTRALLLLLASARSAAAQRVIMSCGSGYMDASNNCADILCPSGSVAECPAGMGCYPVTWLDCGYTTTTTKETIPETTKATAEVEVVTVADEPAPILANTTAKAEAVAPAISPVLSVCATSFFDATVKCVDPSKDCSATGLCDSDANEACFRVAREDCGEPVSPPLVEVVKEVISDPTVAVAQTETPRLLFVCGLDYDDAQDNICTNESCSTVNVRFFTGALKILSLQLLLSPTYFNLITGMHNWRLLRHELRQLLSDDDNEGCRGDGRAGHLRSAQPAVRLWFGHRRRKRQYMHERVVLCDGEPEILPLVG
ncbi:hypothetical protein THAOC_18337 [Thalassiosira oceanica]|uniref:Uncharacterized protein n=1 Tax=Thalassiosira oceanica TaxID=159749 RepID=K0SJR4_THAOC|nr:hypothetical protein THAOC_18337 [Thalassiosira oceanica]|eukprot:EJK61216.1 hypothetical protein THAOC_18337 [Thalassiosira oceanica]